MDIQFKSLQKTLASLFVETKEFIPMKVIMDKTGASEKEIDNALNAMEKFDDVSVHRAEEGAVFIHLSKSVIESLSEN
jgi:hypothetical protein